MKQGTWSIRKMARQVDGRVDGQVDDEQRERQATKWGLSTRRVDRISDN